MDTLDTTCVTMETTHDTLKASADSGTRSKEWRSSPVHLLTPEHCRKGGTQGEGEGEQHAIQVCTPNEITVAYASSLHPPLFTTQDPHSKVTPATVHSSRHPHTTAASQYTSITKQVENTPQWLPFPTDNLVLY